MHQKAEVLCWYPLQSQGSMTSLRSLTTVNEVSGWGECRNLIDAVMRSPFRAPWDSCLFLKGTRGEGRRAQDAGPSNLKEVSLMPFWNLAEDESYGHQ